MVYISSFSFEDCERLLCKYDLGRLINFDAKTKSFDSGVHVFRTTKGKYVLKIFEKSNLKDIKYQNALMDFHSSFGVLVPKNIFNKDENELTFFDGKYILIQGFVRGVEGGHLSYNLVRELARNFGVMHKVVGGFSYQGKSKLDSSSYGCRVLPRGMANVYAEGYQKIFLEEFKRIPKSKLRKGHIHGDISNVNFLVSEGELKAIIDWEDTHFGILVYDIAIFMAQNFIRSDFIFRKKFGIFLREYIKFNALNESEKKALYYLIKYRLVGFFCWYASRINDRDVDKKEFSKGVDRSIKRMKTFDKISLEEFLKFFKK